MITIAPSVLAADPLAMKSAVVALGDDVRLLHLDVMDGRFVPNVTYGPGLGKALCGLDLAPVEAHLMVEDPERHIPYWAGTGVFRLIVHAEATWDLLRTIQRIHGAGFQAGVAINPATPFAPLLEVLHAADLLLFMTVSPGFGGQELVPSVLEKLRRFDAATGGRHPPVEVDGGVGPAEVDAVVGAGARVLVAGSAIFGSADPAAALREMTRRAEAAVRTSATAGE